MIKEITRMSAKVLSRNKMRSALTTLGITIATLILIIVLSVGAGIESLMLSQMSSFTSENIYTEVRVPSKGNMMEKGMETAQSMGAGVQITTLKIRDVEDIKDLANINLVYGMSMGLEKLTYMNEEKKAMIFAVSPDYGAIEKIPLSSGRFYNNREDETLAQVTVIGSDVKKELFGSRDAIGQDIKIQGKNYRVIGVAEEMGSKWFMPIDRIIYIPVQTAQKKLLGTDYLMGIMAQMEDKKLADQTVIQIERRLRKNHGITDPEKDDFDVVTMEESMNILGSVTYGISALLLAIALISLVVGGVGIMNIMYVAVTERTKEIGLRKAVGARPIWILLQFLIESIIVAFVGSIIGAILGISISWLVSFGAQQAGFDWPFIITWQMIATAILVPVFTGIIFGYAPARKAAQMNPVDALRK